MSGWRRGRLAMGALLALCGALSLAGNAAAQDGGFQLERVLGRGAIGDISISPDSDTLAVAGSRGIWLYSLPEMTLQNHMETGTWIWETIWSPDGQRLASMEAGGAVYRVTDSGYSRFGGTDVRAVWLWDAASGERLFSLEDSATTDGVIWSPAGDALAGESAEGALRLWDASNGRLIWRSEGLAGARFQSLTFTPDGRAIVVTDGEGASVWEAGSGALRYSLAEGGELVGWSPDGTRIAFQTNYYPVTLNVYDARDGQPLPEEGFPYPRLQIDPHFKVDWDGYNPVRVRIRHTVLHELEHAGSVKKMVWLGDQRHFLTHDNTGAIYLWDALSGQLVTVNRDFEVISALWPFSLDWTPDGQRLYSDGRFWNIAEGQLEPLTQAFYRSILSPDGTRIAEQSAASIIIRDAESGDSLEKLELEKGIALIGNKTEMVWSPTGEYLAVSVFDWNRRWNGGQHKLLIWNVKDSVEQVWDSDHHALGALAWLPEENYLTIAAAEEVFLPTNTIWILDVENREFLMQAELSVQWMINDIAWSPDGRLLAAGGASTLVVWEVALEHRSVMQWWGKYVEEFSSGAVFSVAWSPDGRYLATGNHHFNPARTGMSPQFQLPSSVMILDSEQDYQVAVLAGHTSDINHVAWSPDGRRLASIGADKAVRIWRAPGQ